jgi:eukaryotic-like serine/threonine-protein kinase
MHMPLWNEIEGETLDGNLPLEKLLRSEGRTAWFATTDPDGQPAVVSVFEALNDEDTALARLEKAAQVQHPNLLIIRRTGSARIGGDPYVYAVMEPFDQTLAEVLRERPLTPEETREVTESLLSALETVEAAGLYHGHVDSAGVLGVGDSIKLRSDCLTQRHGESDAPALAAVIYNALTARRFSSERDALALPAPFATLVRAGAASNGSLAAMRRVLSGPAVTSAGAAAGAPSAAEAVSPVAAPPAPAAPVSQAPRPAAHAAAIPRAALRSDEAESRPRKRPGIAIAAIVLMAIALVVFWYATKRPTGHTPISGEAASAPNPQPAAPAAVPPEATPAGDAAATMGAPETVKPTPRPAPTKSATEATPAPGTERSVWHVVAYTYSYESAAQRKATELAAQYPQLEPQVFSPTGHAPYLVTLGGGMNRQQAFARRDAARTAGMPSDTYAINFRK